MEPIKISNGHDSLLWPCLKQIVESESDLSSYCNSGYFFNLIFLFYGFQQQPTEHCLISYLNGLLTKYQQLHRDHTPKNNPK